MPASDIDTRSLEGKVRKPCLPWVGALILGTRSSLISYLSAPSSPRTALQYSWISSGTPGPDSRPSCRKPTVKFYSP